MGVVKALLGLAVRPFVGAMEASSKALHSLALASLGREGILGKMQRRVKAPGAFAEVCLRKDCMLAMPGCMCVWVGMSCWCGQARPQLPGSKPRKLHADVDLLYRHPSLTPMPCQAGADSAEETPQQESAAVHRQLMAAWQRVLPEFFPGMAEDSVEGGWVPTGITVHHCVYPTCSTEQHTNVCVRAVDASLPVSVLLGPGAVEREVWTAVRTAAGWHWQGSATLASAPHPACPALPARNASDMHLTCTHRLFCAPLPPCPAPRRHQHSVHPRGAHHKPPRGLPARPPPAPPVHLQGQVAGADHGAPKPVGCVRLHLRHMRRACLGPAWQALNHLAS